MESKDVLGFMGTICSLFTFIILFLFGINYANNQMAIDMKDKFVNNSEIYEKSFKCFSSFLDIESICRIETYNTKNIYLSCETSKDNCIEVQ